MKITGTLLLAACIAVVTPSLAQHGPMSHAKGESEGAQATAHSAQGTVRSVDAAKGTASIAHGPVRSLKWPAMTMTFKLKDKAMAGAVKSGEKIDFSFVQSGKDYLITEIRR
jgi:Cu(I)/Ag(I) efflux system periplasmic protein CusF